MAMIENFRNSLDERGEYVALLTDLPKAVDCLLHDLIIAKLHTYGFYKPSVRLILSDLTDIYQRIKFNHSDNL